MKKLFFLSIVLIGLSICPSSFVNAQGVGVNPSGASPDNSAGFDVNFTNKGFLLPRLTEAQRDAIGNPALGLQIFNTTTNCLNLWIGSTWRQICGDCDFNAPTPSNNGALCEGATLNLSATSISGATYQWSGPGGFSSTLQNPSVSNVTTSAGGIYSVVATKNGCSSAATTTTVIVNAAPATPGTISGNASVCPSAINQVYTIAAVSAATSYNWNVPAGAVITSNTGTSITVSFDINPAGNITVSSTNLCGTSAQSSLTISQSAICSPITFDFTGAAQSFAIPAGVASITVEAWGASGGGTSTGGSMQAGNGGYSKGTLTVTAGEVFSIYVGGQGQYQGNSGPNPVALGGWNGGGNSGACQASSQPAGAGGGTDVRFGGTALSDRIMVAGGGGGCYANYSAARTGGSGGGLSGGNCPDGSSVCGGGTQTAGGQGGIQSGSLGQGGNDDIGNHSCGGGGGGGYYGGGANQHSAGGGGSGYISGNSGCVPLNHPSGKVFTSTSMQQGVNHGNGKVVITW